MTTERLSLLNRIVDNYSDQEKDNLEIYYLKGLITKIAENQIEGNDNLIEKIDSVIEGLPQKTNNNKLVYDRKLLNSISNLKSYIKEKYNFVPKGYYKKTYLAIGIALGTPLGLLLGALIGKIGIGLPLGISIGLPLGIPIGLAIGIAIGTNLDKKAIIEKRVINQY